MWAMKSVLSSVLVLVGSADRAAGEPPPRELGVAVAGACGDAAVTRSAPNDPSLRIERAGRGPNAVASRTKFVCPMHPEVSSDTPGLCPKCNMKLESKTVDVRDAYAVGAVGAAGKRTDSTERSAS